MTLLWSIGLPFQAVTPWQRPHSTESVREGERLVPLDEVIFTVPRAHFDTLIKVRMNFNDKLLQSVNEL